MPEEKRLRTVVTKSRSRSTVLREKGRPEKEIAEALAKIYHKSPDTIDKYIRAYARKPPQCGGKQIDIPFGLRKALKVRSKVKDPTHKHRPVRGRAARQGETGTAPGEAVTMDPTSPSELEGLFIFRAKPVAGRAVTGKVKARTPPPPKEDQHD